MNPIELLAQFLNVDATPEAVAPALDELIANYPNLSEEERAAMREALGVADDAALIAMLQAYAAELSTESVEEPAGMMSRVDSLKNFGAALATTTKSRNGASAPVMTQPNRDVPGKKTRYNGGAPTQIGKATKPGIRDFIVDIASGKKSMSVQLGPNGGYILNTEIADDFIPALRDNLILEQMGALVVPMDGMQALNYPKVTTETTAYWVGEGSNITESEQVFDLVTLVPKALAVRVPVPNQLLFNARVNYEQKLREDMTHKINNKIQYTAFFGAGSGAEPVGLLNISTVTKTSLGAAGATPFVQDLLDMVGRVEDAKVEETDKWAFAMSPRSKRTFSGMTDIEGRPILREMWASKEDRSLLGYPYFTSTVIPNNITSTDGSSHTDCSYILFGDWAKMLIGMSNQIEFMVNRERLAHQLQTEIIAYIYADVAVAQGEAFEMLKDVRP